MKEAIEYIKSNWQKGESLKEIARRFNIDSGNLERAFRISEGITIKHYFDKNRKSYILKAISKDKIIGYQIGIKLGFKSDKGFYRWVNRVFGVSYRELLRKFRGDG